MARSRTRRLVDVLRVEQQEIRALRSAVGLKRALAERIREALELGGLRQQVAAVEGQLAARVEQLVSADVGAYRHLEAQERHIALLQARAHAQDVRLDELAGRLAELEAQRPNAARAERASEVLAATAWVDALPPSNAFVSVILLTQNRPDLLQQAVRSVLAQSHQNFELLIIDDNSGPETAAVIAAFTDPRIRSFRRDRDPGIARSRNLGLDHVAGEYVAHLDDDNLMGRSWLRAVVWGFESHPEADVAYGALVTDMERNGPGAPWLLFEPWDRRLLPFKNLVDQNALAHRAGLAGSRYDPAIRSATDWDVIQRLTLEKDPVRVPVIAAMYRTRASGRMSDNTNIREEWAGTQQLVLRSRPLRILALRGEVAVPSAFVRELETLGAQIAWCGEGNGPTASGNTREYEDPSSAVDGFRPDLVVAGPEIGSDQLEVLRTPYVVLLAASKGSAYVAPELRWGSCFVGAWEAATPFGVSDGGEQLQAAVLRHLDRVRARLADFPDPGLPKSAAAAAAVAAGGGIGD